MSDTVDRPDKGVEAIFVVLVELGDKETRESLIEDCARTLITQCRVGPEKGKVCARMIVQHKRDLVESEKLPDSRIAERELVEERQRAIDDRFVGGPELEIGDNLAENHREDHRVVLDAHLLLEDLVDAARSRVGNVDFAKVLEEEQCGKLESLAHRSAFLGEALQDGQ